MTQKAKRYTSVSKGGEFEVVGTSSGAGQRKGDVVVVYRNVETGQILHREPEDFAMRMKAIQQPSINAQLLAALSDALEWIDAVPSETAAALPAMPGFDRDAVNELISVAKGGV